MAMIRSGPDRAEMMRFLSPGCEAPEWWAMMRTRNAVTRSIARKSACTPPRFMMEYCEAVWQILEWNITASRCSDRLTRRPHCR